MIVSPGRDISAALPEGTETVVQPEAELSQQVEVVTDPILDPGDEVKGVHVTDRIVEEACLAAYGRQYDNASK